ncbi:VOC family protein [Saccharothrix sp. HUAS TT1]|uniref:VOC family protein n=1 Tax=unclassified Saccharothrix TaxID=2593673 RepID=UPI00345C2792
MTAERIAPVVPTDDLAAAVGRWSALLGVDPTFVDGDRWAQFDLAGGRLALSGADRVHDGPAVLVKVPDLDEAHARAAALGFTVGEITTGPHERRCVAVGPDGYAVILHSPLR